MTTSQTPLQKLTQKPPYERRSKGRVIRKDPNKSRALPEDKTQDFLQDHNALQPLRDRRNKPRTLVVNHWKNLLVWVGLIIAAVGISQAVRFFFNPSTPLTSIKPSLNSLEKEAFMALTIDDANIINNPVLLNNTLKKQLGALKKANYKSVRLEQVNRWHQTTTDVLPAKPILITFDEAKRETMEIADAILASLGMTALVFVDVDKLDKGNIQLVSWHQLEKLVKTGRWEVGISGCVNGDENVFSADTLLAQKLIRQREQLERRLQIPISTVNCTRAEYLNNAASTQLWNQALKIASLPVGFVVAPSGANYRNDSKTGFKRIDTLVAGNGAETLAQLNRYAPRRTKFFDNFQGKNLDTNWVVGNGLITAEKGVLSLQSKAGEQGAMMALGGTEKWRDAEVEVSLKGRPNSQFWIALRQGVGQSFVRLGIADNKVMLQETNGVGFTKLLAEHPLPTDDMTLKLRVVGSRAMAYLNGTPLLLRPTKITQTADHGAVSLAVWHENAGISADTSNASVQLTQISATPLAQKSAIVAPVLGAVGWVKLRQEAETLSIVSPNYFTWSGSGANSLSMHNTSLEIFARHHHLDILPAVLVGETTPPSDITALAQQAMVWVSDPAYQGLNIVFKNITISSEWRGFLSDLSERMAKVDKTLVVTLLNDKTLRLPMAGNDELLLVADQMNFISTAPVLLYPHSAKP